MATIQKIKTIEATTTSDEPLTLLEDSGAAVPDAEKRKREKRRKEIR